MDKRATIRPSRHGIIESYLRVSVSTAFDMMAERGATASLQKNRVEILEHNAVEVRSMTNSSAQMSLLTAYAEETKFV